MKYFKRAASFLLAIFLLLNMFHPALAAKEDSVLTSIGHSQANSVALSGLTRYVTLTVPFDYAESTVDLGNGLDITYDDTLYKSVVAEPESSGMATVYDIGNIDDTGYIAINISFNNIDDARGRREERIDLLRPGQTRGKDSGSLLRCNRY